MGTPSESEPPWISSSATPSLFISPSVIVTVVLPSNLTTSRLLELPGLSEGEPNVGALFVPPNLSSQTGTTLITSYSGITLSDSNKKQELVSTVLNITLLDSQGNAITQLDSPLIICLALPNTTKKGVKVCLSFYDERKDKWTCEDECLTTVATKGTNASDAGAKTESFLCGQTSHLTNFALLLTGGEGADPCQSGKDNTLAWISLGMVGAAVLVVAFAVLLIEVHIRWNHYQTEKELNKLGARATQPEPVSCL